VSMAARSCEALVRIIAGYDMLPWKEKLPLQI
jgi:hypothetical protein